MSCSWLERVAIAMDADWTPDIDAHVAGCAECGALLADRQLLREAPEIAPEVYESVRARVMERVRPSLPAWWWRAAAAVLLAVAGVAAWWSVQVPEAERLRIAVAAPAAPAPQPAALRRSTVPRESRRATRSDPVALALTLREQLEPLPPAAQGDVAVTMQTEDPNVVIMLVEGDDDE